jgi:hypothetical protein
MPMPIPMTIPMPILIPNAIKLKYTDLFINFSTYSLNNIIKNFKFIFKFGYVTFSFIKFIYIAKN